MFLHTYGYECEPTYLSIYLCKVMKHCKNIIFQKCQAFKKFQENTRFSFCCSSTTIHCSWILTVVKDSFVSMFF